MKFNIIKENLNTILKIMSCVVEKNDDKTNDHCIFLKTYKNKLIVASSNKSLEVMYTFLLNELKEIGFFSVSLKKLINIIKVVPNNEFLFFEKNNKELFINVKNLKFKICLSPNNIKYNVLNDNEINTEFISISSIQLQTIYKKIFFSASNNDVRSYLNGILFDIKKDILYTVASDGHRLSMYKLNLYNSNIIEQIIIPSKNFNDIVNIFQKYEDIKIYIYHNYIMVTSCSIIVKTHLLIGKYPDYMSIFLNVFGNYLICLKKDILNVFLRVSILEKKTECVVKMSIINKKFFLFTYTNIKEYVEDQFDICYYNGYDIVIAFNAKYVIDILNSISSEFVLLIISDFKNAVSIEPFYYNSNKIENINDIQIKNIKHTNDIFYVLMPIRL